MYSHQVAKGSNEVLPFTGVIVTVTDSDVRGAALSIRQITGKPIKFLSVGEKSTANVDEKQFSRLEAIISSMTLKERRFSVIIKGLLKRRIATGSGVQVQDVNRLLKQFTQMMKKMKDGGMAKMMRELKRGVPPGMPF